MYIIILLILTIILFKILFNNFGFLPPNSIDNEKKNEAINKFINNLSSTKNTDGVKNNDKKIFEDIYNNYVHKIKNVSNKNMPNKEVFNDDVFIKSAEKAVVMVLEAFTEKKFDILKRMLTKEMLIVFENNIKKAEINNYNYKTVIVSFEKVLIVEKDLVQQNIVKVNLNMKQINYIEDNEGNIISGSKDKIKDVSENWTFIRSDIDRNFWLLKSIN